MVRLLRPVALCALVALAGCATPSGPIFGDWHGRQPTGDGISPSTIDIVLYGMPGDTRGRYDFRAYSANPGLFNAGNRTVEWGDRWTFLPSSDSARVGIVQLHDLPAGQISKYALMSDGVLIPATASNVPDRSPGSLRYGLTPVPRQSRAYGRL